MSRKCFLMASTLTAGILLGVNAGCNAVKCGSGAVEVNGECVAAQAHLRCAAGFRAIGQYCEPTPEWVQLYCGPDSVYDATIGKCRGTGTAAGCPNTCRNPTPDKICLQGQVFDGPGLIAKGSATAAKITPADNAILKVYDPFEFLTNPSPSPIISIPIDDPNGCFVIDDVPVPALSGALAFAVEDKTTAVDNFAFVALGANVALGKNLTKVQVPAFRTKVVSDWGNDILAKGSMLLWYNNVTTKQSIAGVTPLQEGQPVPWPQGDLFFFGEEIDKAPYFVAGATKTSASGLVAVRQAPLKMYNGKKDGCSFITAQGGSVPKTILIVTVQSDNC